MPLLLLLFGLDSGPGNSDSLSSTGLLPPEGKEPAAFLVRSRPAWLAPSPSGKVSPILVYWTVACSWIACLWPCWSLK